MPSGVDVGVSDGVGDGNSEGRGVSSVSSCPSSVIIANSPAIIIGSGIASGSGARPGSTNVMVAVCVYRSV